ncbi:uncharacterized protein LOC144100456 [Amblyomma americanum]
MVTTDSGQDIAAAPLRRGGPISIARTRLGAEITCGPSGNRSAAPSSNDKSSWTFSAELWQLRKQRLEATRASDVECVRYQLGIWRPGHLVHPQLAELVCPVCWL